MMLPKRFTKKGSMRKRDDNTFDAQIMTMNSQTTNQFTEEKVLKEN